MKNRSRVRILALLLLVLLLVVVTGCVPGDGKATSSDPAGFFWGIWHGWLAPLTLIIGIFNKSIRIYETFNTGWWYDFGFYMAFLGGFGGLSLVHRRRRRKSKDSDHIEIDID